MARMKVKAVVSVELPQPTTPVDGKTTTEKNAQLREYAMVKLLDALDTVGMKSKVERLNLSRTEKDNTDNE